MPGPELTTGRSACTGLGALVKARLEGRRRVRLPYLPLLTIHLASGALGITAVADALRTAKMVVSSWTPSPSPAPSAALVASLMNLAIVAIQLPAKPSFPNK